jgi:hypothetical protein
MEKKFPFSMWNYNPPSDFTPDEVKVWADCGMTHPILPSVNKVDNLPLLIPFPFCFPLQRHTLFSKTPCIATGIASQWHTFMQRHTFSRAKTCVAESERKSSVGNGNEKRTE